MSETINTSAVVIKGRVLHKHDTEANWNKAVNFAPLLGETIIYDPDENCPYPRYKTGIWDGKSEKTSDMLIMNLPFANHKTYTAQEPKIVAVGRDTGGHVVLGGEIVVQSDGGGQHGHTTETTIAKDTYVTTVTDTHTKLSNSLSKDKVIKTIEGEFSNLNTIQITPVSGSTTAHKATAGTKVSIAKTGTPVVYGTADVGEAITGLAKRADKTTIVGNANVSSAATIIGDANVGEATRYGTANVGEAVTFTVGKADVGESKTVATKATTATVIGNANVATSSTTVGNANVGTATRYGTANVGEAVTYGTADVGSKVTVAVRASSQTTIGNANVATSQTNVGNADVGTATRYGTANVGTQVTVDAGKADVGAAVVYGTANVGNKVSVAQQATAQSTFLTGVSAAAPTITTNFKTTAVVGTETKEVPAYHAYVDSDTLCLTPCTYVHSATSSVPKLTPTSGNIYGVSGSVEITPAVAAPSNQTLTPAIASNRTVQFTPAIEAPATQTLTPAVKSTVNIYGAVASDNKIYGVGATTDITPAVASTKTLTPAVAAPSTQTLTPATRSTTAIYGAVESDSTIFGVGGEVTVTSAKAATGTQTIKPAVEAPASQTLTPAAKSQNTIYGAVASQTEIYGVTSDQVSINPAVSAPTTQTLIPAADNGQITPYTFTPVTVPVAVEEPITVATGELVVGATGGVVMIGLGTPTTIDTVTNATIVKGVTGDVDVVSEVETTKNAATTFEGTAKVVTQNTHTHSLVMSEITSNAD